MTKFSLTQIAEKYYEYKEVLEKIEQGEYDVTQDWEGEKVPYTVEQIEMMRKIVDHLDDMRFEVIAKRLN